MTPSRLPLALALAIGLPLISFVLLRLNVLPAVWLGAPNGVFAVGLLLGLCVRGGAYLRGAAVFLGISICLIGLTLWPSQTVGLFPVALNLLLGRLFQSTLRPGSEPMITRIARLVRTGEPLTDELVIYTRRLTAAWAALFLGLALSSLLLAWLASTETVVLFGNSINFAMIATFFTGEYLYRHYRYRTLRHTSFRQLINILLRHGWLIRDGAADGRRDKPEQFS